MRHRLESTRKKAGLNSYRNRMNISIPFETNYFRLLKKFFKLLSHSACAIKQAICITRMYKGGRKG